MKREYKTPILDIQGAWMGVPKVEPAKIDEALDELGRDGWELVSAFDTNRGHGASCQAVANFKRSRAEA